MFDSIEAAVAYLKQNINKFLLMPGEFATRKIKIDKAREVAQKNNNQEALGQLVMQEAALNQSRAEYDALVQKIDPIKDYIASWSLSAFPLVIILTGVATATALYAFISKFSNEGRALDAVISGAMTPTEAAKILSGGGIADVLGNASYLVYAGIAAYLLFLFGPSLAKRLS